MEMVVVEVTKQNVSSQSKCQVFMFLLRRSKLWIKLLYGLEGNVTQLHGTRVIIYVVASRTVNEQMNVSNGCMADSMVQIHCRLFKFIVDETMTTAPSQSPSARCVLLRATSTTPAPTTTESISLANMKVAVVRCKYSSRALSSRQLVTIEDKHIEQQHQCMIMTICTENIYINPKQIV